MVGAFFPVFGGSTPDIFPAAGKMLKIVKIIY